MFVGVIASGESSVTHLCIVGAPASVANCMRKLMAETVIMTFETIEFCVVSISSIQTAFFALMMVAVAMMVIIFMSVVRVSVWMALAVSLMAVVLLVAMMPLVVTVATIVVKVKVATLVRSRLMMTAMAMAVVLAILMMPVSIALIVRALVIIVVQVEHAIMMSSSLKQVTPMLSLSVVARVITAFDGIVGKAKTMLLLAFPVVI